MRSNFYIVTVGRSEALGSVVSVWKSAIIANTKTKNNAEKNPMRRFLMNFCSAVSLLLRPIPLLKNLLDLFD